MTGEVCLDGEKNDRVAFQARADYQNHAIGWLHRVYNSLGGGKVVRFPRIWMVYGECRISGVANGILDRIFLKDVLPKTAKNWRYHLLLMARLQLIDGPCPRPTDPKVKKYAENLVEGMNDEKRLEGIFIDSYKVILASLTGEFQKKEPPAFRIRKFTEGLISNISNEPFDASPTANVRVGTEEIGELLYFDGYKNFGFIRPSNGEEDIFVHLTNIE